MKKFNMSLQQMLSLGIWERVEQPSTVYHMTDRKNLDSILTSRKIISDHDYITWFFTSTDNMLLFAELSNAYVGRKYWDYDGKLHTAPPLIPADTVVLKLHPRYSEPLYWYREKNKITEENMWEHGGGRDLEDTRERWEKFDNCRICHYGALKFKDDYELIEYADLLEPEQR